MRQSSGIRHARVRTALVFTVLQEVHVDARCVPRARTEAHRKAQSLVPVTARIASASATAAPNNGGMQRYETQHEGPTQPKPTLDAGCPPRGRCQSLGAHLATSWEVPPWPGCCRPGVTGRPGPCAQDPQSCRRSSYDPRRPPLRSRLPASLRGLVRPPGPGAATCRCQ